MSRPSCKGCGAAIPYAGVGRPREYCALCAARRATSSARGYGGAHVALRKRWTPLVEAGGVACARCHRPISPDEPWDLDHADHDRSVYNGPAHAACNRRGGPPRAMPAPPKRRQSQVW
jgi:hypothetical protein